MNSGSFPMSWLFASRYWSFNSSSEHSGLISFKMDQFDLLAVWGTADAHKCGVSFMLWTWAKLRFMLWTHSAQCCSLESELRSAVTGFVLFITLVWSPSSQGQDRQNVWAFPGRHVLFFNPSTKDDPDVDGSFSSPLLTQILWCGILRQMVGSRRKWREILQEILGGAVEYEENKELLSE